MEKCATAIRLRVACHAAALSSAVGYGLFLYNISNQNGMMQTLGFSSNTGVTTSSDGGPDPIVDVLNNPLPQGVLPPAGAPGGTFTHLARTLGL